MYVIVGGAIDDQMIENASRKEIEKRIRTRIETGKEIRIKNETGKEIRIKIIKTNIKKHVIKNVQINRQRHRFQSNRKTSGVKKMANVS
jgi:hypothetical protein